MFYCFIWRAMGIKQISSIYTGVCAVGFLFGVISGVAMSYNREEDEERNRNFIQSSLTQSTVKRDKAMAVRFQNWLRRQKGLVSVYLLIFLASFCLCSNNSALLILHLFTKL